MVKQKYIIAVLGLSLMLGLGACGKNEPTDTADTTQKTEAQSQLVEDTGKDSDTEENSGANEKEEETISPYYTFSDEDEENLAAMFFLGSTNEEQNAKLPDFLEKYSLDKNNFEIVSEKDNCEWYAIIPKYIGTKIKVERVELKDDGNLEPTDIVTETEKPILLCCNESDIIASTQVTITYEDKEIAFNPCLSMEDGKLAKPEHVFTE